MIKNIARLSFIIQTLIKFGFGYIVDRAELHRGLPMTAILRRRAKKDIFHLSPAVRVRRIFEELGPAFMKIGQILSTRTDLIPVAYCTELEKLQDSAPEVPFDLIEKAVNTELGENWQNHFSFFDKSAYASASIAQVHLAKLKTGEEVVVKVLKPEIREIVNRDLEILEYIANLAERYFKENFPSSPMEIVAQLKKSVLRELDFVKENGNIRTFRKDHEKEPSIVIPIVYEKYTRKGLLVMERIHGYKINDLESFAKKKWDKQKIARNLTRAIFRQIFVYRFFHADPHPGNIIVPAENKIAFIDFGLTGRVNEETRRWFVRMIQAVFMRDISALMQNMKKLVLFEKNIDEIEFQNDLERLVNEYYSSSLADVRLDKLFEEMFELTSLYDLKISSNLFLLMKCMITLESVVRQLDPEFEILKEIKVYLKNFLAEEYSPLSLLRGLRRFSTAFGDLVSEAPGRMTDIMRQVSHGNLKIQFELLGIDRLLSNLYRIVNRLIFSILAASLLIGSFFVLDSGMKPLIFGYPLFAELGFIFAIILIVIILFDIITYRDWHV